MTNEVSVQQIDPSPLQVSKRGPRGSQGWTPVPTAVVDGGRALIFIEWEGPGTSDKPDDGYLSLTGIDPDIADAFDWRGLPGLPNNLTLGTVSTGAPGSNVIVQITGTSPNQTINFTIPRGDPGAQGDQGPAATITLGTVSTGAPGSSVVITNTGTAGAAVLNFTIPRGDAGQSAQADIVAAPAKTTPVDADTMPLIDSAASNALKKVTWANIKATLKTYFDTLYQPLAAKLTTLAGQTWAADRFTYYTSASAAAIGTITAFGRSLIDDADAAAARTTLGLVIGTNVQAQDAELSQIAALTLSGNGGKAIAVNSGGTAFELASMGSIPAAGAVGSLVLAYIAGDVTTAMGASVAGSSLLPSSANGSSTGAALSGTWRCLGATGPTSFGGANAITLFQRIA